MTIDLTNPWEKGLISGDLSRLDPKKELERVEELVKEASRQSINLDALFIALAEKDLIALADIAAGPRAVGGTSTKAALKVLPALEKVVPAGGLYRRLVSLSRDQGIDILEAAINLHPEAKWIVRLSENIEKKPGLLHLNFVRSQECFFQICFEHASAGHFQALDEIVAPEAVAALIKASEYEYAVKAALNLLEADPNLPLAAWVSAIWGPSPDSFYLKLVPKLRSKRVALALQKVALGCPETLSMLSKVLPGLR